VDKATGRQVFIKRVDGVQHWCLDTLVEPDGTRHDLEKYNSLTEKEKHTMGEANGSVKTKKEKRAAKAKEKGPKEYKISKYETTAKFEGEKYAKLLDKENKGYAAIILRACKKEVLTFPEVVQAVKDGGVAKRDAKVNIEANIRWYLNDLGKKGLLKFVTDKVEATSLDEARGVEA
jgi:hypothetical protein